MRNIPESVRRHLPKSQNALADATKKALKQQQKAAEVAEGVRQELVVIAGNNMPGGYRTAWGSFASLPVVEARNNMPGVESGVRYHESYGAQDRPLTPSSIKMRPEHLLVGNH